MMRLKLFAPRRFGATLLLPLLLLGCVEPSRRSDIADAVEQVSFAVPPQRAGLARGGPAAPPVEAEPRLQPQVYGGTGAPLRRVGAAAPVDRSADGVQLNFERADIREVVKVILTDLLGITYTIDPNVAGEVTLSSSAPLAESDLLAVLESVLRANGAALVSAGPNAYQVVPAEAAIGRAEVLPLGGEPVRVRPGYGLTIVPLRNITATAAAQFIQPLVSAPEDIRIDPGRNAVLFSGTSTERQNVVETLADLDVDWLADKAVGLFPLRLANPEAIIPELQTIFAPFDPTGGEFPLVRFVPIARLNAVLAVGTDREQIVEAGRWVERLDRGRSVGPQFFVYYLNHGSAEDIAKLLNEAFGDASAAATSPGPSLGGATTALGAVAPAEEGFVEEPVAEPPPVAGSEPGAVGGGGLGGIKVVPSKTNNALLIRATPQAYETIEATLRRLDTPPLQVLIEASIVEVNLNDQLRYGVQYFFEANSFRFGFSSERPGTTQPVLQGLADAGFGFVFTGGNTNITIDALAAVANVRVLSSPSIVVEDNSEAELSVGEEVPIITRQASSVEDVLAPTLNTIEYRDTGVILQVRPRINTNDVVSLEIAQEVSRVQEAGTGEEALTPTITQRKVTSRVNVLSGQTVVLGGLIQDSEERSRERVPVLGEIPVLGNLFGGSNTINDRTELIIFITPRVIRNGEDARAVSEELRSRLRSLRPADAFVVPPPARETVPAVPPAPLEPQAPQRLVPPVSSLRGTQPVSRAAA